MVSVRRIEGSREVTKANVKLVKAGVVQVQFADKKTGWFTRQSKQILKVWPVQVDTNPANFPDDGLDVDQMACALLEACVYDDITSSEKYQTFSLGTVLVPKAWHVAIGSDPVVKWRKVSVSGDAVLKNLLGRRKASCVGEPDVVVRFTKDAFSAPKFRDMQFTWRKQLAAKM